MLKFDQILEVNGNKLTKKYIESLSYKQRSDLIDPIFNLLRNNGIVYPDDQSGLIKSYQRIIDFNPDLNNTDLFNNSSIGTDICKFFCKSFYNTTDRKGKTIEQIFNDDIVLKKLIKNRLGMDWLLDDDRGPGVNESFNLSVKMIMQGMRSMRLVPQTSIFKPIIAKYVALKYSNPGDLIGDYSCGFGGRLLGAMSCDRKYIGTDPLTTPELEQMAVFFGFKNYTLINSGSENYCGDENSVDLYWSSPPYFDQEYYSKDLSQAYNNGEGYFYNTYWRKTLENIKFMLKPDKWFGLNVKNYPKMVDIAKEYFNDPIEYINLKTVRSHLNKTAGITKDEYIYMFKNKK
jgi:hypothetical protein